MRTPAIYTVGHSTRSLDELLRLLRAHGVAQLVDVRSLPGSRRCPQFNRETMAPFLRSRRINYRHMKSLGGRRRPVRGREMNRGWRNASFRGYADYMQTGAFEKALGRLIAIARRRRTAILCAEAVPWRCHRSMIADALVARGVPARHIMSAKTARPHALSRMADVRRGRVTYPRS